MADWTFLPKDLVGKISGHLDLLRFRSVCSSWRSFATPRSSPSRSTLFDGLEAGTRCYVAKRTVFLVSPPHSTTPSCWIFKFKGEDSGPKRLLSPFARYPLNSLLPNFPRPFNVLNFPILELGQEYVMHASNLGSPETFLYENKVVVVWINEGSDFLLLTTTPTSVLLKLAFYTSIAREWTVFQEETNYVDVLAHNEKLYALQNSGKTVCVGPTAELDLIATANFEGNRKHLVASRGQLLLVYLDVGTEESWDSRKPIFESARVFKVDEESRSWIPVHSLDGWVLFLGNDLSFSAYLPGCSGDCILFLDKYGMDEDTQEEAGVLLGGDIGVLELDTGSAGLLCSYPEYAKTFWPPPDWVSSEPLEKLL